MPCALAVAALAYQQGAHLHVWWAAGFAFLSALAVMIARAIHRLKRSRILTGLHFAVFIAAAVVGYLALVEGDRLRTERAAQEQRVIEQQLQRAKEEAERKDREVAERCIEMIERLRRRRNAANADYRKCVEEAPKATFWNQRTASGRCKEKEDATKRALNCARRSRGPSASRRRRHSEVFWAPLARPSA